MLEEVEVAQPLGLGVMDPMQPFDPRRCKPAAGDKVDDGGEELARGVEINASHAPRFANAKRAASNSWFCIHGLLLPWLNAAQCRIQLDSIVWSCGRRQGFAAPGFARP